MDSERTEPAVTPSGFPDTSVARLVVEEALARRLADGLAEMLDAGETTVASFEVKPGLWAVEIHFEHEPDQAALRSLVADLAGDAAAALSFSTVAAKDWVAASLEGLKPVPAGRFVIHGAHDRARIPRSHIGIEIEAALAFGTGHHGTTRGCLMALDRLVREHKARPRAQRPARPVVGRRRPQPPAEVLDVGTGTGVLAIAAARALRRRVRASDIDRASIDVARDNIRHNHAAAAIDLVHAGGVGEHRIVAGGPYAVVLANILLPPLRQMAAPLARLVAPGGHAILSGILDGQAAALLAAYRPQGLVLRRRTSQDGWTTLVLARRPAVKKKRPG